MSSFNENDFYRTFSRRAFLIGAGQMGLLSVLVGRLYYLQIIESEKYTLLAQDNSIKVRLITPARGQIFDCHKKVLVTNYSNFKAVLKENKSSSFDKIIGKIRQLILLDENVIERAEKHFKNPLDDHHFILKENLIWAEVTVLEINALELPGLNIEVGLCRHYPYGPLLSGITGYVSRVTGKEQEENNPLFQMPDFKIGKSGIEKTCDLELRGEAGARHLEVNALGKTVREMSYVKSKNGKNIELTIDLSLQQQIEQFLSPHKSASAVVIDIHNGAVQAMVSTPGFDPNLLTNGIRQEEWHHLVHDPLSPLQNKAISGVYSPGSTFKMVVAMAALEAKTITLESTFDCAGFFTYCGHRFHCWRHKEGHGKINVLRALRESCDVFFYEIALLTGIDKIAQMGLKFGLGQKTGIELTGEQTALLPTKEWKSSVKKHSWIPSDTILIGIGQGYMSCTPLQLAVMTARIANGGYGIQPFICAALRQESAPSGHLNVSLESLKIVQQGMDEVINHPRGSAYASRFHFEDIKMSGKTGTAQVRRISAYERAKGLLKGYHRPWHEREHALFVGYAPSHNPQYAVAVVIEHAGGGAHFAAPVGRDILMAALGIGKENHPLVGGRDQPPSTQTTAVKKLENDQYFPNSEEQASTFYSPFSDKLVQRSDYGQKEHE